MCFPLLLAFYGLYEFVFCVYSLHVFFFNLDVWACVNGLVLVCLYMCVSMCIRCLRVTCIDFTVKI